MLAARLERLRRQTGVWGSGDSNRVPTSQQCVAMYKQTRTVSHVGRTPCVTVRERNLLEPSEQSWGRVECRALYPRRRSGNAVLASQYFNVPVSREVQQVPEGRGSPTRTHSQGREPPPDSSA